MPDFKKTEKQKDCVRMLGENALHCMAYGGSRSGKTFIIIFAIIVRACKCKSRHGVFRKTFNSLKTSIWLDTLPKVMKICFPKLSYTLNKTDYYMTIHNGSEVWFCGLDDEKRIDKVLGKEFSTLYFNECSEISYYQIQVVLTRLAQKNKLQKKVYYDMNPPTKSHWSYWLFIRAIDPIESEPIDNPENYCCILMNPQDNIENIDEDYIENVLMKMPEAERNRFLKGLFTDVSDGQAYYAFDRDRHVSKDVVRTRFQVEIGMDFNVHPMTSVQLHIVNDELHVFSESFLENSDTYKMCDHLKKNGFIGGRVVPDSTGKNRKTSGKSDFAILKEYGFTIPPVRNPLQVDRVNNINFLLTNDRIKIHPSCKKLINDLEKVVWKDGKLHQKGEDKMLTHISDCLGYVAWKYFPIRTTEVQKVSMTKYR